MKAHRFRRICVCAAVFSPLLGIAMLAVVLPMTMGCNTATDSPSGSRLTMRSEETARQRETAVTVPVGDLSEEMIGQTVAVEGKVTQQCPAVGCWIIVRDQTGKVFIDLKPGNLELSEKHEGERARVDGRVIKQAGQLKLEAQSIEFGRKPSEEGKSGFP